MIFLYILLGILVTGIVLLIVGLVIGLRSNAKADREYLEEIMWLLVTYGKKDVTKVLYAQVAEDIKHGNTSRVKRITDDIIRYSHCFNHIMINIETDDYDERRAQLITGIKRIRRDEKLINSVKKSILSSSKFYII